MGIGTGTAFLPCVAIGSPSVSVVRQGCCFVSRPPNFRPATCRKRSPSVTVLCLAQSATDSSESAEEGVVLDENAMRAAEIHEVLNGLKDFKARIIADATRLAKKVRAPKKQLEASLKKHPDILKIDGHIVDLEEELKQLGDR